MKTERNTALDIVKGICIILMVSCHGGMPFREFPYYFHIAAFFIAAGCVFKDQYSNDFSSFLKFVWKKILRLWLPIFLCTSAYLLLHNFFININVYTNRPEFLQRVTEKYNAKDTLRLILRAGIFLSNTQLGGAFWFVRVLFVISILYCFVDLTVKTVLKDLGKYSPLRHFLLQGLVSAVLLIVGYRFGGIFGTRYGGLLSETCSFYILFYLGVVFFRLLPEIAKIKCAPKALAWLASLAILVWMCIRLDGFELGANQYVHPAYLLIASVSGWIFVYGISAFFSKVGAPGRWLAFWGRNTMPIVLFHFLAFKVVSLIGLRLDGRPMFLLAAFPYLYEGGLWWVAYTCAGILLPVGVNVLWKRIKPLLLHRILPNAAFSEKRM